MSLHQKLSFLRTNKKWKCMVKWEALDEHETTWRTNGLANLTYDILKVTHLPFSTTQSNETKNKNQTPPTNANTNTATNTNTTTTTNKDDTTANQKIHIIEKSRASIVHTDVKLNNGHWADDKCGTEYMGH